MSTHRASEAAAAIARDIRDGNRRVLAQACTLAESTLPADQEVVAHLSQLLPSPTLHNRRIAISGPPGVGKSTVIEAWGKQLLGRGNRVAVLAIDPSSKRSGGSILGDKTRMQHLANDSRAFVRPQPAGNHLGGAAVSTRLCIQLCEAAGFDTIIVETVGVGQSETEVSEMVDMFVLLALPAAGDDLQGIKRGIMEVADVVFVTKSDLDISSATRAAAVFSGVSRLLQPSSEGWRTRVIVGNAIEASGTNALTNIVDEFFSPERNDYYAERRRAQSMDWFDRQLNEEIRRAILDDKPIAQRVAHFRESVFAGTHSVPLAVHQAMVDVLEEIHGK